MKKHIKQRPWSNNLSSHISPVKSCTWTRRQHSSPSPTASATDQHLQSRALKLCDDVIRISDIQRSIIEKEVEGLGINVHIISAPLQQRAASEAGRTAKLLASDDPCCSKLVQWCQITFNLVYQGPKTRAGYRLKYFLFYYQYALKSYKYQNSA